MIKLNPINNVINLKLSKCFNRVPVKVFDSYAKELADRQKQVCKFSFALDIDSLELLITVLGNALGSRYDFDVIVKYYGLDLESCADSHSVVIKRTLTGKDLKSFLIECMKYINDYILAVGTYAEYLDFCDRINRMIDGSYFGVDARNNNEGLVFEVIRYIIGYAFILQRYHNLYSNGSGRLDCADYQIGLNHRDGTFCYQPALHEAEQDSRIILKRA